MFCLILQLAYGRRRRLEGLGLGRVQDTHCRPELCGREGQLLSICPRKSREPWTKYGRNYPRQYARLSPDTGLDRGVNRNSVSKKKKEAWTAHLPLYCIFLFEPAIANTDLPLKTPPTSFSICVHRRPPANKQTRGHQKNHSQKKIGVPPPFTFWRLLRSHPIFIQSPSVLAVFFWWIPLYCSLARYYSASHVLYCCRTPTLICLSRIHTHGLR